MTKRISLAVLGLVALVLLGAVLPLGFLTASHDRDAFLDETVDRAPATAHTLRARVGSAPAPLEARAALEDLSAADEGLGLWTGSRYLATTGRTPPVPPPANTGVDGSATEVRIDREEYALARVRLAPTHPDGPSVILVRPMSPVEDRIHRLWLAFAAVVAIAAAASIGLAVALSRWVGRPLARLESATHAYAGGAGAVRPRPVGPPEVRRLTSAFNSMADRLDTLILRQRSVIADVAHQLRTPMAALRLRLDLVERNLPDEDADLTGAMHEVQRLSRLVDGLLAVARAEAAQDERSRMDVMARLTDRVEVWAPLAAERGVELSLRAQAEPVGAWGVADHLDQVMDNLLANAFDTNPAPSRIRIDVVADRDQVTIVVADDGPGMSQEQRDLAFQRFTTSRADHRGSGLGLAIVAALVAADGGEITLVETPGGGLTARLTLPRA
jgi:signal transduction histidine kinase